MAESMPNPDKIRILLVDDHQLTRCGIARLLRDEADFEVVGELASGEAALEFVRSYIGSSLDVILMDSRMPGIGGVEATHQLLSQFPNLKILGVSSIASGVVPSQMIRAGALGFITKNIAVEELVKALQTVAAGGRYVAADVANQLAMHPFNQSRKPLFDRLSRREMQISQMLTDGKKVSQISDYLKLSPKTVYSYRYRIFEKLGIRSDVELTILAVKHGLTENIHGLESLSGYRDLAG